MNLTITEFKNRLNPRGRIIHTTWDELVKRLEDPVLTNETVAEYQAMSNSERTDVKDVGGYIGGECEGGKRSKTTVKNRCLLTIDADDAKPGDMESYGALLPYTFFCHTTHTSTKEQPRLRWIFPLSRPVTPEEYRVLSRIVAVWVGEGTIDDSTDQPERIMFWPSIGLDTDWRCLSSGSEIIDPDKLLEGYDVSEEVKKPAEDTPVIGAPIIPEGVREKTIMSHLGYMRGTGIGREELFLMAEAYNRFCSPPLTDADLHRMVNSVCNYKYNHVVPEKIQNEYDSFADLGEIKDSPQKRRKCIRYESLAQLARRNPKPPEPIIDEFLYPGLTLLVAPPKLGKSFMCMDIGRAVSEGEDFMGLKTHKTGVLYIALEDDESQINARRDVATDAENTNGFFIIRKKKDDISMDGIDDVEAMLADTGDEFPRLDKPKDFLDTLVGTLEDIKESTGIEIGVVIFDVFSLIRGVRKANDGVYDHDHRESTFLHRVAWKLGISIIAVHHTNKSMDNDDPMNRSSGSLGLPAGADEVITLYKEKRSDSTTFMDITGRFFPQRTDVVRFDNDTKRWELIGSRESTAEERDEQEFYADPIVSTIRMHLAEAEDLADDPTTAYWVVTGDDFIAEIKRSTGYTIASTDALGRKVKKLEQKLMDYERIKRDVKRIDGTRGYKFYRIPEFDDPS